MVRQHARGGVDGSLSLVAPLANVLALPLVPWIMLFGALLAAAGLLLPAAAPLCATLTWTPVTLLLWAVDWTASLPWAAVEVPRAGGAFVAAYLLALVALCWWLEARGLSVPATTADRRLGVAPALGAQLPWRVPGVRTVLVALGALACAGFAVAGSSAAATEAPHRLVAVPHVPGAAGGSAVLLQAPDGTRVLINGGPTAGGAAALLGGHLRPWDRPVDALIAADPRDASLTGLQRVVDRYRTGTLLDTVDAIADHPSPAYRQLRDTARARGVQCQVLRPGTQLELGRGIHIQAVGGDRSGHDDAAGDGASRASRASRAAPPAAIPLALRVQWGSFSVFVPGDGTAAQRRALASGGEDLRSTVLVLTSRTAGAADLPALVRAVEPELIVIQGDPPAAPGGSASPPDRDLPLLDGDRPMARHVTAADGPLRLAVGRDGYRLLPAR